MSVRQINCQYCGAVLPPPGSSGRPRRYCNSAHRLAASRRRKRCAPQRKINAPARGPGALTSATIVPDTVHAKMYRIHYPDGTLSDMVNLTRAKDALWSFVSLSQQSAEQPEQGDR